MPYTPLEKGKTMSARNGRIYDFCGALVNFGKDEVLDTRTGFVFRESESDYHSFIVGIMKNAQTQADELAKKGVPNAVPTIL